MLLGLKGSIIESDDGQTETAESEEDDHSETSSDLVYDDKENFDAMLRWMIFQKLSQNTSTPSDVQKYEKLVKKFVDKSSAFWLGNLILVTENYSNYKNHENSENLIDVYSQDTFEGDKFEKEEDVPKMIVEQRIFRIGVKIFLMSKKKIQMVK